jgi:hypothetical protein
MGNFMVNAYDASNPEARPDIAVNLPRGEAEGYAADYNRRYGFATEVVSQTTGKVVRRFKARAPRAGRLSSAFAGCGVARR